MEVFVCLYICLVSVYDCLSVCLSVCLAPCPCLFVFASLSFSLSFSFFSLSDTPRSPPSTHKQYQSSMAKIWKNFKNGRYSNLNSSFPSSSLITKAKLVELCCVLLAITKLAHRFVNVGSTLSSHLTVLYG